MMTDRVIVIGAGPAGTSTAWHLAQQGVPVTILDRATFPRDKVCAEYVSPQAVRILSAMGALPHIQAAGAAQLTGMRVRSPSGSELTGHFAGAHAYTPFHPAGLGIRRTVLDTILVDRARLAGATILEGLQVTDITRDAQMRVNGVSVRDASGKQTTLAAAFVIGADGLRSTIARRININRRIGIPQRIALVAHYRNIAGVGDEGEMHVTHNGYVGIAAVNDGLTNVAVVVPATEGRVIARGSADYMAQWLLGQPHLAHRFAHAQRVTPVRATGPFGQRVHQAWAPGAAVVGDAADFLDPFTGEGIYAALRGGELLAPFIVEEVQRRDNIALAEYDRARKTEFSGKWMVERIIASTVAHPLMINHATRALQRRRDMADLLIGVTGDFVPPREVLRLGYIARLVFHGI